MAKVAKRLGRYVLDYYEQKGVRRRETLKAGTTLKQAKDQLREIEERIDRGTYIPEKKCRNSQSWPRIGLNTKSRICGSQRGPSMRSYKAPF